MNSIYAWIICALIGDTGADLLSMLYCIRILNGKLKLRQVPGFFKAKVEEILADCDMEELIIRR